MIGIDRVPHVEPLSVDDVMKGRPVTGEEFERMLAETPKVVGTNEAASWQFALRIVWFSGFRIGDLMDFHWTDDWHIRPIWSNTSGVHPTITVPSSQKNRKVQEIPMLPELDDFLSQIPMGVNLRFKQYHSLALQTVPVGEAGPRSGSVVLFDLSFFGRWTRWRFGTV